MDDPLVGAASERKVGIAQGFHERAIHKGIYIWKNLAETLVRKDFLICESCVAPYVLSGLLLDPAGQFGEGLHLIERISSREGDISELVRLDYIQKLLDGHIISAPEVPRLRIMTAGTCMGTARTIYRGAQTGAVCHRLICNIQNSYLHNAFQLSDSQPLKPTDLRHAPQVSIVKLLTINYLDDGHFVERGAGRTSSQDFMASYASCDP